MEIVDADMEKLEKKFVPLYMKEIASRQDFTLDREKIVSQLADKISQENYYKFLFIYYGKEIVTAIMFSLKNNGLYLSYKANNKDFDKALSHKATVSYWTEKLIFNYGKSLGIKFFSYGRDSNPYIGKTRIGLPLYKLKTGMKAKKPPTEDSYDTADFSAESLKKHDQPLFFFTNPDESGFYKDCFLYYPEGSIDESYLKEFKKVTSWSEINFDLKCYPL
ncbi:MAG: hypothetical protein PHF35_04575 [Candidatus Moranbacteria bacterium]|nr:hypothetical protein [Candidatus Moranbacteria bacterium]